MFSSFFLSKNQKLVKKWTNEHEEMVTLINQVLAEYAKNNHPRAKKLLKKFSETTINHITDENIQFFKLLKDEKRFNLAIKKSTEEFVLTFKNTRLELMKFFSIYTQKYTILDAYFFNTLVDISEILYERIKFEEDNLYLLLSEQKKREEHFWEQHKRDF